MPFKEYSKEKMRFYRSLILFGLILFYGLQNIPTLWMIFMRFLSVLTPFFIGGALAFVLNILVVKIECLSVKLHFVCIYAYIKIPKESFTLNGRIST